MLIEYVKAEVALPPLTESSSREDRVRKYFRARKEARVNRGGVKKTYFNSFRNSTFPGDIRSWTMALRCNLRGRGGHDRGRGRRY
ncbi:unnamed protein product [Heligmosomoides polygyrus]|uniref:Uncharacterized protein n=1 Tax=Heligmosomoides polygyrus TaxID=6339 RepID=A0A183GHX7_HELPZ|nr:unnamed protein product [Heligmosomoides polygyrus]